MRIFSRVQYNFTVRSTRERDICHFDVWIHTRVCQSVCVCVCVCESIDSFVESCHAVMGKSPESNATHATRHRYVYKTSSGPASAI